MDIQIVKLNHNDCVRFQELIRLFEDVFEMKNFKMPAEIYLQKLLKRDIGSTNYLPMIRQLRKKINHKIKP